MSIQEIVSTIAAFEAFIRRPEHTHRRYELIHGTIVERMAPTQEHGFIAVNISSELRAYVKANSLGRVSVETAHTAPNDDYNVRIPDVSFISGEGLVKQGAVPTMPDLAVEIKSPDDTYAELREKANYYLSNGAKLVWLVYPQPQRVEVYAVGRPVATLEAGDTLTGGAVLPGFSITVADLFT